MPQIIFCLIRQILGVKVVDSAASGKLPLAFRSFFNMLDIGGILNVLDRVVLISDFSQVEVEVHVVRSQR